MFLQVGLESTLVTIPLQFTALNKLPGNLDTGCVVPFSTLTAEDHFCPVIWKSADTVDRDPLDAGLSLFSFS